MQPEAFDRLDFEEAEDLVERIERMQLERDKQMLTFFAKLFETTTFILGTGLGLKLKPPRNDDERESGVRNDRDELDWYGGKEPPPPPEGVMVNG